MNLFIKAIYLHMCLISIYHGNPFLDFHIYFVLYFFLLTTLSPPQKMLLGFGDFFRLLEFGKFWFIWFEDYHYALLLIGLILSRPAQMCCCVICFKWSFSDIEVGLEDLQRSWSHPTPTHSVILCVSVNHSHRMAEVIDTSGDHLLQLFQLWAGSARASHPRLCVVSFWIAPCMETQEHFLETWSSLWPPS